MKRLLLAAVALIALAGCHPAQNNLVPATSKAAAAKPAVHPMDGDGGPPTVGAAGALALPSPSPTP